MQQAFDLREVRAARLAQVVGHERCVRHDAATALFFAIEQAQRIPIEALPAVGAELVEVGAAVGGERGPVRRAAGLVAERIDDEVAFFQTGGVEAVG